MTGRLTSRDRHRAREAALQMLYLWEVGRGDAAEVPTQYWAIEPGGPSSSGIRTCAGDLAQGTIRRLSEIDPLIAEIAEHWRLVRMAVVDRLILRLAVFELLEGGSAPASVVINEALELARTFSTEDAVKFVNGVLDGIRRRLGTPATDAAVPDP